MKRSMKKKGFTLVELIVVIAILAILATVSIVGYVSFVTKAKVSNDISLTTQINNMLIAAEAEGKPGCMSDAMAIIEENFDLEKLTPTAENYSYVWDSKANRVALLDDKGNFVAGTELSGKANAFAVVHNKAQFDKALADGYSIYLAEDYDGETTLNMTSLVSVDAGKSKVNVVNYGSATTAVSGEGEIIVCTNGGTLTINAPTGNVHHYGVADSVNIVEVAPLSYHEHGVVRNQTTISKGHYVAEKGSQVISLVIKSESVTVKVENGATVGGIAPSGDINLEGKVEGAEVLPAVSEELLSKFAGGLGTAESPFIVANAEQFLNIGACGRKAVHIKLAEDIVLEGSESLIIKNKIPVITYIFNGVLDGAGHSITFGDSWNDTFKCFCQYGGYDSPAEIKNLTVYNTTGKALGNFMYQSYNVKFTNVNMGDMSCTTQSPLFAAANNCGGFLGFAGKGELIFENCTNYYNYEANDSTSGISPFIAGYNFSESTKKIAFKNCKNYGTIVAPHAGLFMANDQSLDKVKEFTVENCETIGEIQGFETAGIVARGKSKVYADQSKYDVANLAGKTKILKDATLAVAVDPATSKLVITQASNQLASKYVLSYTAYARIDEKGKNVGTQKTTVSIELNPTFEGGKATVDYGKYKIIDAASYNALTVENKIQLTSAAGKVSGIDWNYYIDSANGFVVVEFANTDTISYTANSASITISIQNASGNIIATAMLPKE